MAIHSNLNKHIERKCRAFARFYFLSTEELLLILSHARNPASVQPYLKKCFEVRSSLMHPGDAGSLLSRHATSHPPYKHTHTHTRTCHLQNIRELGLLTDGAEESRLSSAMGGRVTPFSDDDTSRSGTPDGRSSAAAAAGRSSRAQSSRGGRGRSTLGDLADEDDPEDAEGIMFDRMISSEGEEVKFVRPVTTAAKVETWLGGVEASMRDAIRAVLSKALKRYKVPCWGKGGGAAVTPTATV